MIRLRTLGTLDLRGSGGEELRAVLAQPRRAALLAYLALAVPRGVHRRDTILALFWPELDLDRARNALGQALHFLRKSVGDTSIESRNGEGLALDWDNFWCDAAAFEDALDAKRIDEALALYRGDLLQGFHIDDAPDFERWLDAERARLAARYTKAVETLALEREAAGDFHGAAAHWRVLAMRDPYNSRLTLRLMRALKAAGDPAGALLQAREHERLLRDELGIAPDAEVAALVRQLLGSHSADTAQRSGAAPAAMPTASAIATATADPTPAGDWLRRPFRRAALLAAGVLIAAVVVGAAVVTSDKRQRDSDSAIRTLYERGRQLEVDRSFASVQSAAQYYRLAIQRDSTFAPAYAALSEAFATMAHYDFAPKAAALDSARILAHRSVALDSTLPETHTALAYSLANDGHFVTAEQEFRRALALDSLHARTHQWYAMMLVALGRGHEALATAERALELNPVASWSLHSTKMMATYLVSGERPQSKLPPSERQPILTRETGEPWARAQRAMDLAGAGRCDDARSDLAMARSLVPDSSRVMLAFAGGVHVHCGTRSEARAVLERMKKRNDPHEHGLRIAMLHTWLGERDSAFVWLQRQRWMMSELAMLSGGQFVDPLRADKRFPAFLRQVGVRTDDAPGVSLASMTVSGIPKDVFLRDMYVRGRNAERSRSEIGFATARAAYERAIARDSTFAPAYAGLALVYGLRGHYGFMPIGPALDSALMMARRAISLDSARSETRAALGRALADIGEFRAAEREFRRAIQLDSSDAMAHQAYSVLLIALGRGEEALHESRIAVKLDPLGLRASVAMQRHAEWLVTRTRKHLQLPVKERRPWIQAEPGDPWPYARQAVELAESGDCADARTDLERALRLAPDNVQMRAPLAQVEWWCGERSRARLILDQLKRRPDARDNGIQVATLHKLFGETDSAFVWLERHSHWTAVDLAGLSAGPGFDALRSDARLLRLQRRLGIRD